MSISPYSQSFCPILPTPERPMSYKDIQSGRRKSLEAMKESAAMYANYLWVHETPARAILALCKAIYLPPNQKCESELETGALYDAFLWILNNHQDERFLGNPRVSFFHQASRVRESFPELNRMRAWALWHLTMASSKTFDPDPDEWQTPPSRNTIENHLQQYGQMDEGLSWRISLNSTSS